MSHADVRGWPRTMRTARAAVELSPAISHRPTPPGVTPGRKFRCPADKPTSCMSVSPKLPCCVDLVMQRHHRICLIVLRMPSDAHYFTSSGKHVPMSLELASGLCGRMRRRGCPHCLTNVRSQPRRSQARQPARRRLRRHDARTPPCVALTLMWADLCRGSHIGASSCP